MRYNIFDPSGNITALVEAEPPAAQQPAIAETIMKKHPETEQVGFVSFADSPDAPFDVRLRMAGGEFCGNASMCAASLFVYRSPFQENYGTNHPVRLQVSGVSAMLTVSVLQNGDGSFSADITMPGAKIIKKTGFEFGSLRGELPVVMMQGITHIIIDAESAFWDLKKDRKSAEQAVRQWCQDLSAEACGLMFLDADPEVYRLTPLVYVPGSETLFWERSCASGSAASGMFLAAEYGTHGKVVFHEPGGYHAVMSDPAGGNTRLFCRIRFNGQFDFE